MKPAPGRIDGVGGPDLGAGGRIGAARRGLLGNAREPVERSRAMSSRAGNPKDGLSAFRARADNLLIGTLGVHFMVCLVAAALTDSWVPALGVRLQTLVWRFLIPALICPFVICFAIYSLCSAWSKARSCWSSTNPLFVNGV